MLQVAGRMCSQDPAGGNSTDPWWALEPCPRLSVTQADPTVPSCLASHRPFMLQQEAVIPSAPLMWALWCY